MADRTHRSYGMAWGVGGFLILPFLQKIGPRRQTARTRGLELKTTFASRYTKTISLRDVLDLANSSVYKRATGEKYLIDPNK